MPTYHMLIIHPDTQVFLPRDLMNNKEDIVVRSGTVGLCLNVPW